MNATNSFDEAMLCKNQNEAAFVNIYEDDNLYYREFSNEDLADIHIIQKN